MAKAIYNIFNGGLSNNNRYGRENQFSCGIDVDIYRNKGYLNPSNSMYNITGGFSSSHDLVDIIPDPLPSSAQAFALTNAGRIYRIKNIDSTPVIDTTFNTIGYDTVNDMLYAKGLYYTIDTTSYMYWVHKTSTDGYLNRARTVSWSADKRYKALSSRTQNGEADIIEWRKNLWITSGRYLDKYTGSTDTLTPGAFDLGAGWSSTCLFDNQDYLGIFASKKSTIIGVTGWVLETRAYLIDDSSATDAVKIIPLKGINKVYACSNLNGEIYFLADSKKSAHVLCKLNDNGYSVVRDLEFELYSITRTAYAPPFSSGITINDNKLIFGVGYYTAVFCYEPENDALTIISAPSTNAGSSVHISTVKNFYTNSLFVSYYDSSSYKLGDLSFGGDNIPSSTASTGAVWKGIYTDIGQKCILNYIKVYFSSNSGTFKVSVDVDYPSGNGTDTVPQQNNGIVSSAVDSGTSKKFDLGQIECHAFRPCIFWTSGRASISKIVIDYTIVED